MHMLACIKNIPSDTTSILNAYLKYSIRYNKYICMHPGWPLGGDPGPPVDLGPAGTWAWWWTLTRWGTRQGPDPSCRAWVHQSRVHTVCCDIRPPLLQTNRENLQAATPAADLLGYYVYIYMDIHGYMDINGYIRLYVDIYCYIYDSGQNPPCLEK